MMARGSKVMNSISELLYSDAKIDIDDDIVKPLLFFIKDAISHMDEEDEITYPDIEAKSTPDEIEKIEQYFAKCNANKADLINGVVLLANQLQ
eukprot:UN05561